MATSPTITFRCNLALQAQERDFTMTSSRTSAVLHPDRYSGSPDAATASIANRANYRTVYLPGLTAGENRILKNGEQFTETGERALYYRDTYAIGWASDQDNALLEIVSQS